MQMDINAINDRLGVISNQVAGVAKLLKRRAARKVRKTDTKSEDATYGDVRNVKPGFAGTARTD
jgi:hypothetical protein